MEIAFSMSTVNLIASRTMQPLPTISIGMLIYLALSYNPFEQAEDGLGVTILKNMAKQIDCRREGDRNRITNSL